VQLERRKRPTLAEANNNLGVTLRRTARIAEGIEQIETAIREHQGFATAHFPAA
jgi:hypothetical protein